MTRIYEQRAGIQVSTAAVATSAGAADVGRIPELDATGKLDASMIPGAGSLSGFDEAAQDAVGAILVDSATIDFTYTDATPSITADVKDTSITAAKLASTTGSGAVVLATAATANFDGLTLTKNQNATTTLAVINTDTTSSASRGQLTIQGGSTSARLLALSGSTFVIGTTTASDIQLQRNNSVIATLAAGAFNINTGLSLQMNSVDVVTSARHPVLRSYTVATLPAANDGEIVFASNGRKTGEGAGAGTGVPVYRDGGTWFRYADDTAVVA